MLQLLLIALYHYVCRHFATHPALHFQRQSNNDCPNFTDQKRTTIHLFGLLKHRFSLRMTYDYILEHWADWFPQLPSYQAVNYPLNQFGWPFESGRDALSQHLQTRSDLLADVVSTDSVPIIRSPQPVWARVALGLTDKGYCATKKLFYQGLKWHMLATDRLGRLPLPQRLHLRAASVNDLSALRVPVVALESVALVGDKAYASAPFADQVAARQNVRLVTPLKKAKGQG